MNKLKSWLMITVWSGVLVACFTGVARAHFAFSTNVDGTLTLTKCSIAEGEAVVPASMYGRAVTRIGDVAFFDGAPAANNYSNLARVVIPDGVTNIGVAAFAWCTGLTNVVIPASVRNIERLAFYSCGQLEMAGLPSGVTNFGLLAFSGTAIRSVTIPSQMQVVPRWAFQRCTSLTNVFIPDGVRVIDMECFSECSALRDLVLPDTLDEIRTLSFHGCYSLTSVYIPYNVTNVPNAFSATGIGSVVVPDGVEQLVTGGGAPAGSFMGCSSLTNLTVGRNVNHIGNMAFFGCTNLTQIVYRGNPPEVNEDYWLMGLEAYRQIYSFPTNQTPPVQYYLAGTTGWPSLWPTNYWPPLYEGKDYFQQLSTALLPQTSAPGTLQVNINFDAAHAGARWQVDGGAVHESGEVLTDLSPGEHSVSFTEVAGWGETPATRSVTISTNATPVVEATYPFSFSETDGQLTLKCYFGPDSGTVAIPRTINGKPVVGIGRYMFPLCRKVTGLSLPDTLTNLNANTLRFSSLRSITVDAANPLYCSVDGVVLDKAQATVLFCPLARTNSFTVPETVTTIGPQAFAGAKVQTIVLGSNVTTLGEGAFADSSLRTINLDEGLVTVGDRAFSGCAQMREFRIPDSVTYLGIEAFAFTGATNIVIGDGVPTLRARLAAGVPKLKNFTIGNGVTNIEPFAFSGIGTLSRLYIPATVRRMDNYLNESVPMTTMTTLQDVYFGGDAPEFVWPVFVDPSPRVHFLYGTSGWNVYPWTTMTQVVEGAPEITLSTPQQTGEGSGGSDLNVSGSVSPIIPEVNLGLDDEPMTNVVTLSDGQSGARPAPDEKTRLSVAAKTSNPNPAWAMKWPHPPKPGYHRVYAKGANRPLKLNTGLLNNLFFYSVPFQLNLVTNLSGVANGAAGKISALRSSYGTPTNGATLILERSYSVTATPSGSSLFSNWMVLSNDVVLTISTNTKLTFVMQSNLTLVANFASNSFTPLAGTYYGLFSDAENLTPTNAGFCKLTLSAPVRKPGMVSGQLTLAGETVSFTGASDLSGSVLGKLHFSSADVTCQLQLPLGAGGAITGTVSETNGAWTASLSANPAAKTAGAYAGSYTMVIPGAEDSSTAPGGHGFGLVKVASNGRLTLTTSFLGDGTPLPQAVPISAAGDWPFFAAVNTNKGAQAGIIMGWLKLGDQIDGTVNWVVPADAGRKYYPSGFEYETYVLGSRYVAPVTGLPAISLPGGVGIVLAEGGDLPEPLSYDVAYTVRGAVNSVKGPNVSMSVIKTTGKLTGTFTNAGISTAVNGVVLQNANAGYGWFGGTNGTTGNIHLLAPGN